MKKPCTWYMFFFIRWFSVQCAHLLFIGSIVNDFSFCYRWNQMPWKSWIVSMKNIIIRMCTFNWDNHLTRNHEQRRIDEEENEVFDKTEESDRSDSSPHCIGRVADPHSDRVSPDPVWNLPVQDPVWKKTARIRLELTSFGSGPK